MNRPNHAALAAWFRVRFASTYEREALIGDLIEEFALGRSRRWLWGQVFAALRVRGVARLRAPLRAQPKGRSLAMASRRLAAVAVVSLVLASRRGDTPSESLRLEWLMTLVFALSGVLVSVALGRGTHASLGDSRFAKVGFVPKANIVGHARPIWLNWHPSELRRVGTRSR